MQVKPWLKSTGPKSAEGKAKVAQNAYRGAVRPKRRAIRREGKATFRAFDAWLIWEKRETRIEAWLDRQFAKGLLPTAEDMKRARMCELPIPCSLPADCMAMILAPLKGEG